MLKPRLLVILELNKYQTVIKGLLTLPLSDDPKLAVGQSIAW